MRTAVGHPRLPVVTEAVVEIEEAVAGIGAHPCPRGRGRYRAIESRARAIGVEQREATAKATVVIALLSASALAATRRPRMRPSLLNGLDTSAHARRASQLPRPLPALAANSRNGRLRT
ncbi:hypothetical protein G6F57_015077 [Rhizopus arrhizus]|nr:hypothetical protein G6F57_015077 [Rhizopus arrhizus]